LSFDLFVERVGLSLQHQFDRLDSFFIIFINVPAIVTFATGGAALASREAFAVQLETPRSVAGTRCWRGQGGQCDGVVIG
jgi:hypothetical protein